MKGASRLKGDLKNQGCCREARACRLGTRAIAALYSRERRPGQHATVAAIAAHNPRGLVRPPYGLLSVRAEGVLQSEEDCIGWGLWLGGLCSAKPEMHTHEKR